DASTDAMARCIVSILAVNSDQVASTANRSPGCRREPCCGTCMPSVQRKMTRGANRQGIPILPPRRTRFGSLKKPAVNLPARQKTLRENRLHGGVQLYFHAPSASASRTPQRACYQG